MILRRFRFQIVSRVAVLAATIVATVFLTQQPGLLFPSLFLVLAVVYQCAALIRYMEMTARDLGRLLMSIRYSDFTQNFGATQAGGAFRELGGAFRSVMEDFRAARAEKEEGYRYLETVMQHIGIGLISFREDGSVDLINTAAKRLLRRPHLKNVHDLDDYSPELVRALMDLRYGDRSLVKVVDGDEVLQISVSATGFKVRETLFKLVSLQDIQGELDEMEVEAWRKLTRVLTHEIMNSVAPISSLASTASGLLDDGDSAEARADVAGAVRTIARRSESLLAFVDDYRKLTKVPAPDFTIFPASDLLQHIVELMGPAARERSVRLSIQVEPASLELTADRHLIEQVLINLVKNALESTRQSPNAEVRLEASIDLRSRAVIRVVDNGHGIVEEAMDKIFVPFFTTKKDGSGIGLSLSREIMRQHGGSISATSRPGEETVFRLRF